MSHFTKIDVQITDIAPLSGRVRRVRLAVSGM